MQGIPAEIERDRTVVFVELWLLKKVPLSKEFEGALAQLLATSRPETAEMVLTVLNREARANYKLMGRLALAGNPGGNWFAHLAERALQNGDVIFAESLLKRAGCELSSQHLIEAAESLTEAGAGTFDSMTKLGILQKYADRLLGTPEERKAFGEAIQPAYA